MRVLVTGCAGFIGSHLCERLLADGHDVTGVDALTGFYDFQRLLDSGSFRFLRGELLETDQSVFQDAQLIFHLAARPGVRTSWGKEFELYLRHNVLSTQYLLECASRSEGPKRIVFTSSSSVYGDSAVERVPEDHTKNPVSPYGVTKLAGEQLCSIYALASGMPVVTLRLFTVYGPRQRPDMAFHRLIHAALTGTKFVLYGDGQQRRDFTFVLDVVEALMLAAKTPPQSDIFNIAGGGIVSMNEAIDLVQEIAGCAIQVERVESQSGDVRHTGADLSKSHAVLGYVPRVGLREGLRAQIEFIDRRLS